MILFTKPNCENCEHIKATCDLTGVEIQELDENPEALALLAYYECVRPAEKGLPILVTTGSAGLRAGNLAARDATPYDARVLTNVQEIAEWLGINDEVGQAFQPAGRLESLPHIEETCSGDACAL